MTISLAFVFGSHALERWTFLGLVNRVALAAVVLLEQGLSCVSVYGAISGRQGGKGQGGCAANECERKLLHLKLLEGFEFALGIQRRRVLA